MFVFRVTAGGMGQVWQEAMATCITARSIFYIYTENVKYQQENPKWFSSVWETWIWADENHLEDNSFCFDDDDDDDDDDDETFIQVSTVLAV